MDCILKKVKEEFERGWIGSNTSCKYHPCHFKGQDCTFCYCPFYPCNDERLGFNLYRKKFDDYVWDCQPCLMIHDTDVCKFVMSEIERMNITDPKDSRIKDIFEPACKIWFEKQEKK